MISSAVAMASDWCRFRSVSIKAEISTSAKSLALCVLAVFFEYPERIAACVALPSFMYSSANLRFLSVNKQFPLSAEIK
jgi:hypothetical protein